jgi:uncharacterized protein
MTSAFAIYHKKNVSRTKSRIIRFLEYVQKNFKTMNKLLMISITTAVLLLIDWYVWQAVRISFQNSSQTIQNILKYVFWTLTTIAILGMWMYNFLPPDLLGRSVRVWLLVGVFVIYVSKVFAVLFILIDDIRRAFTWIFQKISSFFSGSEGQPAISQVPVNEVIEDKITRSEFMMKTALVAGSIPAVAMTWGIISGAHDYRIWRIKLAIKNLPKEFEGMTIAQISDVHSGSFFNKTAVKGGIEMILGQKPDAIFFTGDLVNNRADEFHDYFDVFKKLKAPLGVYSTLGNHDYGDYHYGYGTSAPKRKNLQDLMAAHKLMGWNLLNDEHRIITEGSEKLAIIGVQNSAHGRFARQHYGDLVKAHQGTQEASTKLLLSHDPTHWDGEVLTQQFADVDVTFSGHTHGAQFGVPIAPGKTWSPAQHVYKQWAGLYKEGEQQLYVNRGFGYIGFPGRIGMPPEITIFELTRS